MNELRRPEEGVDSYCFSLAPGESPVRRRRGMTDSISRSHLLFGLADAVALSGVVHMYIREDQTFFYCAACQTAFLNRFKLDLNVFYPFKCGHC